jgi:hypothetical protein
MFSSLPELQKERGFPHPSRKKKLLKFKRESTRFEPQKGDPTKPRFLRCDLTKPRFLSPKGAI